ncbi:MAG TPA: hypothetical protein VFA13_07400 [Candidatus Acidoferrum sp.]|jgi:hypothetical protein|nr:hypothetical protein [Candidatus Acidoferrum sp.]
MTELYLAASQGDKAAQVALDAYARTQAQVQGGKTGAVITASTPKDLLQSETKSALDAIGAPPKNTHDEYASYAAQLLLSDVPRDQIPSEEEWAKRNTEAYNAKKSAVQAEISEYTKSKAWNRGLTLDQWRKLRAKTAAVPGVPQQSAQPASAPAPVPGTPPVNPYK